MTTVKQGTFDLTRQLAQVALGYRSAKLPESAITVARQCILDWFAVTLPGSREECAILLSDELESFGSGPSTVVGRAKRLSPYDAALVNGTASHALDFDDVNRLMQGHPTVAIFPAVFAVAEATGATGKDLLTAFIAGYEAACMVGSMVNPSHYARGIHSTGTVGSIGAAVGVGVLLQLDEEQMTSAIGLGGDPGVGPESHVRKHGQAVPCWKGSRQWRPFCKTGSPRLHCPTIWAGGYSRLHHDAV
ncbi:MmgE/PrpD family protein [Novosphingobium colocasiae]